MSKLLPRLIAVLLTIGCCSQGWAQLTIDATCTNTTVQCLADLDTVTCPTEPTLLFNGDPIGTADCLLVSERDKNRENCTATTAMPISGSNAGALVLYNLNSIAGVNSQYFVPTGDGLQLQRFESGQAILSGTVEGVTDPSEQWNVFLVYEGLTSDNDHVAGGGGLKYDAGCAPIDTASVDWDIYYMNGGLSFLEGAGSLDNSLLSLNHAPSNQYFGFQVGDGANDRNCNYGAGGWFSWSGVVKGNEANGAMGDVLVDLACTPPEEDGDCEASVTCYCVGVDPSNNEFEVFTCTTSRNDTEGPDFVNAPEDATYACTDEIPGPAEFTAVDNCEPGNEEVIDAEYLGETIINPLGLEGCHTIVRTWKAIDACGNESGHTQTITVVDEEAPTWDAYDPWVMESCLVILDSADAANPALVPISASDNCDGALDYSIEAHEISGGCPTTWLRKWTATDDCGNVSATVEQYVQLYDDTPPAIDAPADITLYVDDYCGYDANPEVTGLPTYSDHCTDQDLLDANLTFSDDTTDGACDGATTITRTWSTTDFCLNENSDTQVITILDSIPPTGSIEDHVLDCAAYSGEDEYGTPAMDDNCSDVTYTWTTVTDRMDADSDGDHPGCYYYDREYTFTDACGNTSTAMQRVWLTDTTPPTLISADENRDVTCDAYGENQGGILITAEDDCGEVTITFEDFPLSGGCVLPVGRFERIYTIADECGNSINFTQELLLTDDSAPELTVTCLDDMVIYSDENCNHDRSIENLGIPGYSVTDNCTSDDDVYVTRTFEDGPDQVICQGHFSFTREWTIFAMDPCGNFTLDYCTQEVSVMDNTAPSAPELTVPAEATEYLDENCEASTMTTETGMASATTSDNCDDNPQVFIEYSDSAPEYDCDADAGSAFLLDASLGAMESASTSFEDDLVAVGIDIELDWASDGCTEWPSDLTLEITAPGGECLTIAGYVNMDPNAACDAYSWPESWNTTTEGTFMLNIELANELSGSGTWTLEATENYNGACGVDFSLNATMVRRAEGSYEFTRTWTAYAVDCAGNQSATSTGTQTINVVDEIAPTFDASSPLEYTIACHDFDESTVYDVTASDNCDSNVLVEVLYNEDCDGDLTHGYDNNEVSGGCAGAFLRTYIATDDCGNTTTFVQTVMLVDDVAPAISLVCPANAYLSKDGNCEADDSIAGTGDATVSVTDNCDPAPTHTVDVSDSEAEYSCPHSYTFTRTWTVTAEDECGNVNTATCSQQITVADDAAPAAPAIQATSHVTLYLDGDCAYDAGPDGDPDLYVNGNDNCSADSLLTADISFSDDTAYSDDCSIEITRTWSATLTDECDNTSDADTFTQTISILDTISPSIHLDAVHEMACEDYDAAGIYATASDNCDDAPSLTLVSSYLIGDEAAGAEGCGTYMHHYLVTDCSGNVSSASHEVHLIDNEAPEFVDFPADATAECGTSLHPEVLGTPGYEDNCVSQEELTLSYTDSMTIIKDSLDCRTIERSWTVTDPCGNSRTQIQEIVVEDSHYPTMDVEAADETVECDGAGNLMAFQAWLDSYGGAQASDDCTEELIWDYEVPVVSAGINPQLSDGCGATGEVTVTFYATDACGNSTPTTATFTIVDTQAPELTNVQLPGDYDLNQNATCNINTGVNITGIPSADATDDVCCYSFVSIDHEDGDITYTCEGDDDLLEGSYSFVRTWTLYAYDECGNESEHLTHEQTITVHDNSAPQFSETCGYTNGQSIPVDCAGPFGELDIPGACDVAAQDNCDSDVSIECSVDTAGEYAPNGDVVRYGMASTPGAFLDNGNTCNNMDPHAMRLFGMPSDDEFYTLSDGGLTEVLESGELHLTATLTSTLLGTSGWTLDLLLDPETACGISHTGGTLQSCDPLLLGIDSDDIDMWEFFILNCNESSLEGFGPAYAGGHLDMSHQPANGHYAFQLGTGANQQNAAFGLSGWFHYSGTTHGEGSTAIMGSGDLFFDMDLCLPWTITHTCTATDDCGNSNSFSYTYSMSGDVDGDDDSDLSGQGAGGDHTPVVIGGAGDLTTGKTPIRVTNLQPNPTNDISQLGFVVTENMRIRVDLIAMDGVLVTELYDGVAQTGVNHTLDIDAQGLSGGMYQIRLTSNDYLVVKKLLVSE